MKHIESRIGRAGLACLSTALVVAFIQWVSLLMENPKLPKEYGERILSGFHIDESDYSIRHVNMKDQIKYGPYTAIFGSSLSFRRVDSDSKLRSQEINKVTGSEDPER